MKSKILSLLFKQYNLGTWLGASFTQIGNSFFYVTIGNTIMLAITAWSTPMATQIISILPWFNFWWFLFALLFCYGCLMLFDLKFVYPARQAFQSKQSYAHENPFKTDMERLFSENVELKNELLSIKKYLKIPDDILEKK